MKTCTKFMTAAVAAGLMFAGGASAQSFSDAFNSIDPGWVTDRYPPADFSSQLFDGDNRLHIGISTADALHLRPPAYQSAFYNTQGRQRTVGSGTVSWTVSGDVYVSADMLSGNNLRRTDLWARTGLIGNETGAKYPIIGIRRFDPSDPFNTGAANIATIWRVWDGDTMNGWVNLATPVTAGWHTLSITANGASYVFKIDGSTAYTDSTVNTLPLTTVFLQAFNFGQSLAQPGQNYDAYWDNVSALLPTQSLTLQPTGSCYHIGNTVTVNVNMSGATQNILGGQFFLGYDVTKLSFVGVTTGSAPFTMEIYRCTPDSPMAGPCIPLAGQIDYGVGVPFGNTTGTAADTTMAVITFTAAAEVCNTSGLVYFRSHVPSSYLTMAGAVQITPVLTDLSAITVDNTLPVISPLASNLTVECDGAGNTAQLNAWLASNGGASATDTCSAVTWSNNFAALSDQCAATGTATVQFTATDACGNFSTSSATFTILDTTPPSIAGTTLYSNGFEVDTSGWTAFGGGFNATRVPSGTNGITSASGSFHGENSPSGSAGNWGGYNYGAGNAVPTVFKAYSTSVDIYLNVGGGWANNTRFDFSSAINNSGGTHLSDFIFNAGFYNDTDGSPGSGTNRFIVSASFNSQPGSAFAKNPAWGPIAISTTGWYTFKHRFYNNAGVLACEMTIRHSSGALVNSWTRSSVSPTFLIGNVGGNRYGWFDFNQFSTLAFDNTSLVLTNPPAIMVNADAGGCTAAASTVNAVAPAASDQCSGSASMVGTRSDLQPLSAPYPTGTTTITWTSTDGCGLMSTSTQTVTVSGFNEMVVSVELAGGGWPTDLYRCVTFQLFNCPTATTVSQQLHFVNGIATNQLVLVPCGNYSCITARDRLHTLRRTADPAHFGTSGTQYFANFTGTDALLGGNLNDDMFIDILDFGGFAGKYLFNYGTGDTTCSTPSIHADISGDGLVFNEDFSFIQINFLVFSEANCCMLLNQVANADPNEPESRSGKPVTSISVKELNRRGLSDLAKGDLNHDGMLDTQDIAAFLGGARP